MTFLGAIPPILTLNGTTYSLLPESSLALSLLLTES